MTSAARALVSVSLGMLWVGCGGGGGATDGGGGGADVWTNFIVHEGVSTRSIAIALDPAGSPHLAFLDSLSGRVLYASPSGDAWTAAAVPGIDCADEEVALALDAAGHAHLAYQCDNGTSPGGIRYAYDDGTAWHVETVESSVVGARNPSVSIALTTAGDPAIAYYAGDAGGLRYATRDAGGTWGAVTPDATQYAGFHGTSLAFDAADHPMLSYYVYSTQELRLARFDGASWSNEVVDSGAGVGERSTLRLDTAGRAHLAYVDSEGGNVKYAVEDTTWATEVVGSGYVTSLALASDGTPWIAFGESAGSWLDVGSRSGPGSWSVERVPDASPDWTLSLAVDGAGARHLAWDDFDTGDAMYARR